MIEKLVLQTVQEQAMLKYAAKAIALAAVSGTDTQPNAFLRSVARKGVQKNSAFDVEI